jgi:hypothetical protein
MIRKIIFLIVLLISLDSLIIQANGYQNATFDRNANLLTNGSIKPISVKSDFTKREKSIGILTSCQPDNIKRPEGVPENIDLNALGPKPTNLKEFQEWIGNLLGSQIRVSEKFKNFFVEGDFNGDGCQDVAVIIEPDTEYNVISRPDDPNTKPRTNRNFNEYINSFISCETQVTNLLTNFAAYPCQDRNATKKLTTTSPFALLIVNGGLQGWHWEVDGKGRTHILLNAFPRVGGKEKLIELSLFKKTVDSKKTKLPQNMAGDGIYIQLASTVKPIDLKSLINRRIVYFNGQQYAAQVVSNVN